MLKSLWTGESGLKAHNVGLSVVSNNIANINTNGFKYSSVTFQDLMSETQRIGSSSDDSLGGANAQQIGLGVKVGSIDKVYTQGSLSQTDRSLDLAIQGNGFFMTSVDDGQSYNYTRDGGFHLDSSGNLVTTAGYKIQGWTSNPDADFQINQNERAGNINIEPGMVLEANPTEEIKVKANLNASTQIETMENVHGSFNSDADLNNLFTLDGKEITRNVGDKISISFNDSVKYSDLELTYDPNNDSQVTTVRDMIDDINKHVEDLTGTTRNQIFIDGLGRVNDPSNLIGSVQGLAGDNVDTWVKMFHEPGKTFNGIGETSKTDQYKFVHSTDVNEIFNAEGEKIDLQENQGIKVNIEGVGEERNFVYRNADDASCSGAGVNFQDPQDIKNVSEDQILTQGFHWLYNDSGEQASFNVGDKIQVTLQGENGGVDKQYLGNLPQNEIGDGILTLEYGIDFTTIDDLMCAITERSADAGTHRVEWDDVDGAARYKVVNPSDEITGLPIQWIKEIEVFQDYTTEETELEIVPEIGLDWAAGEVFNFRLNGVEVDLSTQVENEPGQISTMQNIIDSINNRSQQHGITASDNGTGNIVLKGDILSLDMDGVAGTTTAFDLQATKDLVTVGGTEIALSGVLEKENKTLGEYAAVDTNLDIGVSNNGFSLNNDGTNTTEDWNTRGDTVSSIFNMLEGMGDVPSIIPNTDTSTYSENMKANDTYYFTNTQELLNLYQLTLDDASDIHINRSGDQVKGEVYYSENGNLEIANNGSSSFNIGVDGYPDEISENKSFTELMNGLNGFSVPGNKASSKSMNVASHIVTTQVYDNYGQSYNVDIRFEKYDSGEEDGKIKWNFYVDLEEPATITSMSHGQIEFNGNGAFSSQTVQTMTFTPNSGKNNIPVNVNLNFGKIGEFDQVVSQNGQSNTINVEQDGYEKGELQDISINSMGVINGIFTNGKSQQLAQLALAMFANEEGLETVGSNTLAHSANSGEPIITSAAQRGAGLIQSNAIERSNVDLSKELVNLIVQQRGLQANSKTLSTADSVLETILNIKR